MNYRKLFSAVLLSLTASMLVAGCDIDPPRRVYTSTGAPALRVTCSESFESLDDCYDRADKQCPMGYRKLEEHEAPQGTSETYITRGRNKDDDDRIETTRDMNRSLTFQCK
jgi:hypothetical protein